MEGFYDQDVFISYRQNDNRSGWVSSFVEAFQEELATLSKHPISIYFDHDPDHGLHDSHHVDKSLEQRLKCAVFVPILSQTYCDPKSFAWTQELCAFHRWVQRDHVGKYVQLNNGNVVSRILPVRIHDLDAEDEQLFESETGEIMRSIDFIYKSAGVNRPLRINEEHPDENQYQTLYRDQINKLALAVKEILASLKSNGTTSVQPPTQSQPKVKPNEPYRVSITIADEPSSDEKLLKKLHEAVEENLSNELFSVEDLADAVAYSRSYLHRKLQRLTGMSISQFIRGIRLQHALELLKKDVGTISEIAYRVGFNSNTYFTKCFSEHFGFTPGEVKGRSTVPATPEVAVTPPAQASQSTPLEALHPAAAETLIREIFESLVVYKPELEKFLIVNEEEGEHLDIRLLAYQTIKSYPYIIGIELRRLFSGRLLEDEDRYRQILKTIDHGIKLLAYVLFSELIDQLHEGEIKLSGEVSVKISCCLQRPDIANLTTAMEAIHSFMRDHGANYFVEELPATFDDAFFRELHEVSRLTSSENTEWTLADKSRSLEQSLIAILKKLAFLIRYRFVNVDSIEVNKIKFQTASFEHHLHILNSTDSEFKIHREQLPQFSDSHAVLLMKSIREPNQFLNLSPFIIDTHTERKESVGNYKKDIYLFVRSQDGDAFYTGIESCAEEDLAFLEHRKSLADLFNVTLNLIGK